VVKNGVLLTRPMLTVSTVTDGELGLLGVVTDPSFTTNHYAYIYYTTLSPTKHNRVSRFTVVDDTVQTGSETILVDLPGLGSATNHNGGALHFGPDGKLYVAVGERNIPADAQNINLPFGKMLRFNQDGSIPTDNPFYAQNTGVARAVWASGLRNPFTFAFQGSTGRLFINDVGQDAWEEINEGIAGSNYGWPLSEGATTDPRFRSPLFTYGHSANPSLVTGLAIVGADFYEPPTALFGSAYVGSYFFADYVNGWVNRMDPANGNAVYAFARNISSAITDLRVGPDGALYVLADVGGSWGVYRYLR
jgi:glucose/arabinose dehydrogenase